MTKYILLLMVLFTGAFTESAAQQLTPPQQKAVDQAFKNKKIAYFKFNVRSMQEIPQFAKILSVDKTQGMTVMAHADKAQFSRFIRMNIPYTMIPATVKTKPKAKPAPKSTTKPTQKK